MVKLNVSLGVRSYPIYISTGFEELGKSLASARLTGKAIVITDENVDAYYSEACIKSLSEHGFETFKYSISPGESSKNLDTVTEIYRHLNSLKPDRKSTLVALGGGVVGDIAGFAAATFLRGINLVQIPTSLLAQADSSVGGKVGVDFEGSKNIIGAFYQPKLVYININTLKTLPKRELQSGLAEVVKHGLIMDSDFYDYIDYNIRKIFNYDADVLQYIARMNCTIKGNVIELDEREDGLRAILNFGHTIGHAIESVSGFELLHGECVGLGMIGAYKLAFYLGMIDEKAVDSVTRTLEKIGLPVKAHGMSAEKVYAQMFHDKKIKGGKLVFVLPKGIGEVITCTLDNEELIKKVIGELLD
jgi:3-dehydroquinate synthase